MAKGTLHQASDLLQNTSKQRITMQPEYVGDNKEDKELLGSKRRGQTHFFLSGIVEKGGNRPESHDFSTVTQR